MRNIAIEIFKRFNKLIPSYMNKLVSPRENIYNLRKRNTITVSHKRAVKYGTHSFASIGTKIWNELGNTFRDITDIKIFRDILKHGKVLVVVFVNFQINYIIFISFIFNNYLFYVPHGVFLSVCVLLFHFVFHHSDILALRASFCISNSEFK